MFRVVAIVGLVGLGIAACSSDGGSSGPEAGGARGDGGDVGGSAVAGGGQQPVISNDGGAAGDFKGSDGGSAGDWGSAGAGGSPPAGDPAVAALGEACSFDGALACRGFAQKLRLVCQGGTWHAASACASTENCDTSELNGEPAGTCKTIVAACAGLVSGERVCEGSAATTCGPDLVSEGDSQPCMYACDPASGKCVGHCVPSPTTTTCNGNMPQFCDALGAWKDGPSGQCPDATPVCFDGKCGVCVPNDTPTQCQDTTPRYCDANGTWQSVATGPCAGAVGQICTQGVCGCPAGQVVCNGSCVDTQTDLNNCGACGTTCTGDCQIGECLIAIASHRTVPTGLAVDDQNVYFSEPNVSKVSKIAKADGVLTTFNTDGNPHGMTVAGGTVYWANSQNPGGYIGAFLVSSSAKTKPAIDLKNPYEVAVDSQNIYWVTLAGAYRAPLTGAAGAGTLLAPAIEALGIAVDNSYVYFSDYYKGTVQSVPLLGGAVTDMATNQARPYMLAVDADYLYWTELGTPSGDADGAVLRRAKSDGKQTILARGQSAPEGIAVDNGTVYFTTGDGKVMKIPPGGLPLVLATGQNSPTRIAVDQTSVYWINNAGDADVMKATPK